MPKIMLCDVDDVCLSWHAPFFRFLIEDKGYREVADLADPTTTDIHVRFGVPLGGGRPLIQEFQRHPDFARLPAFDDARQYLNQLHAEGWIIHAISAADPIEPVHTARSRNLRERIGDVFTSVTHTGTHGGSSKLDALKCHPPGSVWIDDHPRHMPSGLEAGHRTFLMSRPLNHGFELTGITRVACWGELYDHVC